MLPIVLDNRIKILYSKRVMLKVPLSSKKLLVISLMVLGVLAAGTVPSYYFYDKYQKSQELLKNPTEAARTEVKTLVERVSRHIELPNEEPTVATVSDKQKLNNQPFFAKAENGDKVLIYTKSRKAILFRPTANKIIEVSTVSLGAVAGESTSASETSKVSLVIYNGTNTVGLTSKAEKQVRAKLANVEVLKRENANKNDYDKTVIVALSPKKEQEAKMIAEFLGGEISTLPEGEEKAEAEIIIILGSDYIKR